MRKAIPLLLLVVLAGCAPLLNAPRGFGGRWRSNGERIYFTATNERGERIPYRGGPAFGGMMGASLTCASCHGPDGRGGRHVMHMQVMDAPDIRIAAMAAEEAEEGEDEHAEAHADYSLDDFRRAVVEGKHPNGDPLDTDMPRWQLSDEDLADLFAFLQTLP